MTSPTPRSVGTEKQLLFDDRFVDEADGFEAVLEAPAREPDPVLVPDRPWEDGGISWFLSVLADEGRLRMWYCSIPEDSNARLLYAESTDGREWEKPELGVVEYRGDSHNNIVFDSPDHAHPGTVFYDRDAPPAERFTYLYGSDEDAEEWDPDDGAFTVDMLPGYRYATSPDGIHWTREPTPIVPNRWDSQSVAFRDGDRYVIYGRYKPTDAAHEASAAWDWDRGRAVARTESDSFEGFPPMEVVVAADEDEYAREPGPRMDVYNQPTVRYPWAADTYLMFPSTYYHHPTHAVDVQLATSRDGIAWTRHREPFLRLGPEGAFDSRMLFAGVGLPRRGDELLLYYVGGDRPHAPIDRTTLEDYRTGVGLARLDLDRFVARVAPRSGATLTTVPITFAEQSAQATAETPYRLLVDVDASAGGWLSVELLDADGSPIEGFARAEADRLYGNDRNTVASWNGRSDVSALHGADAVEYGRSGSADGGDAIRLRFRGRGAKLYGFRFVEAGVRPALR